MIKKSVLKNISLIVCITLFLSFSLPDKAYAQYGYSYFSAEGFVTILAVFAMIGFIFVTGPNLIPAPTSVATGESFVMRAYAPIHPWVEFDFSGKFSTMEVRSNLLIKDYCVKAPLERGVYDYERKIFSIPLGYKISVLSETEARAGVVNPTAKDFDRNPFFGAILQSLGFIFSLGYIYADEMSTDDSWPWQVIKSCLLGSISYVLYDKGVESGQKYYENSGFYLGLGTMILTTWDVVRIINAKNEYAGEIRRNNIQ